jgi:TetR/AcrR family transcriptional regulator
LMISGYGALLSYFSDAALLEGLLDSDPFSSDELKRRADHVIDLFASALGVRQAP